MKKILMSMVLLTIVGTSMVFAQEAMINFKEVPDGYSIFAVAKTISGVISIPEKFNGKKVVAIADNGFKDCRSITGLKIPNSVIQIGDSAFEGCTGITDIKMGDGVTLIGNNAFKGCSALRAFEGANIGKSVKTISSSAFEGCKELRKIWIRESVNYIDSSAFRGCVAIERVNFQQAYTNIGANAFPDNEALIKAYKAGGKGPYDRNGNTWTLTK